MRFEGQLKTWNEAKGFGFVTPSEGGQDIFLHASALPKGTGVPTVGQTFTFEVELNPEGKKRATKVQLPGSGAPLPSRATPSSRTWESRAKRSSFGTVVALLLVAVLGLGFWQKTDRLQRSFDSTAAESGPTVAQPAVKLNAPDSRFRCDGRTHCSQMTSCAEAKFFLAQCPGTQMDGDGDGTPCEKQWCTSPFSP